jgi:hypothetical protein
MSNTTTLGQTKPTGIPYLEGAACTAIPNVMDGRNVEDVMRGLGTCRACPVLELCAGWTDSLTPGMKRSILNGVVAGQVWGEAKRNLSISDRLIYGGIVS